MGCTCNTIAGPVRQSNGAVSRDYEGEEARGGLSEHLVDVQPAVATLDQIPEIVACLNGP